MKHQTTLISSLQQVITRGDTKTSMIPASFSMFVPHQAPPTMLNPFPLPPDGKYSLDIIVSIILVIGIPIVAVKSLIIVIKKHLLKFEA